MWLATHKSLVARNMRIYVVGLAENIPSNTIRVKRVVSTVSVRRRLILEPLCRVSALAVLLSTAC